MALLEHRPAEENGEAQVGTVGEGEFGFEGLAEEYYGRADDEPPLHIAERVADFALFPLAELQNAAVVLRMKLIEKADAEDGGAVGRLLHTLVRAVQRAGESAGVNLSFHSE